MLRKIFIVLLVMLFCFSLCSVALGAGKTEKGKSFMLVECSGKIPPGQLKKMNMDVKASEIQGASKGQIKEKVKIKVRGNPLISDLPPVIRDGRTLIPVRAVIMGLGALVEWDAEERKITVSKGDITIVLYADEYIFYVNGVKKELDVPAQLISNRTFVPLRFLAMALNIPVDYDEDNDEVIIGDEILENFSVGGNDVLSLEGIIVQSPEDAGATLQVNDFTNLSGITVKAQDEETTTVTVLLNGVTVENEDLADQTIEEGDTVLAIVTATGDNGTVTKYYKLNVTGIPSASFIFIGPYNLAETDQDISGFSITVKQSTYIDDDVPLRYLFQMTQGNMNGKVIQYGELPEETFTIQNGKAYFGPQEGFTLSALPELKEATGITTSFTIKDGLAQGVYKFTFSLVDLNGKVLAASGEFSIVVGP